MYCCLRFQTSCRKRIFFSAFFCSKLLQSLSRLYHSIVLKNRSETSQKRQTKLSICDGLSSQNDERCIFHCRCHGTAPILYDLIQFVGASKNSPTIYLDDCPQKKSPFLGGFFGVRTFAFFGVSLQALKICKRKSAPNSFLKLLIQLDVVVVSASLHHFWFYQTFRQCFKLTVSVKEHCSKFFQLFWKLISVERFHEVKKVYKHSR